MSFGGGGGLSPLPATPTTPVSSSSLPAPITLSDAEAAGQVAETGTLDELAGPDDALPDGTTIETASVAPADGGAEVTQDDLIGVWSATTTSATCSINLSLTNWTGGFRASTRNCGDVQLASLGAWNVEGRQVFLKDGEGNTLARLFRTADTRYAGQLESGQAITVFR